MSWFIKSVEDVLEKVDNTAAAVKSQSAQISPQKDDEQIDGSPEMNERKIEVDSRYPSNTSEIENEDRNNILEKLKRDYFTELAQMESEYSEKVTKERKNSQQLQFEILKFQKEADNVHSKLRKQIENMEKVINTQDHEISKLRQQLTDSSSSKNGKNMVRQQEELENRLQLMTEHLLQKQSQIEVLNSEKAYLQIQLENSFQQKEKIWEELQRETVLTNLTRNRPRNNRSVDEESEDVPLSQFLSTGFAWQETRQLTHRSQQRDGGLIPLQQVSHSAPDPNLSSSKLFILNAATRVDQLTTFGGKLLRRNPLLRLFFLVYLFILHYWFLFVFLYFNPEIHEDDGRSPSQ